jgi:hypothetical protein
MFARNPDLTTVMNGMATLGALAVDRGRIFVGSRLSIYEDSENLLDLHVRLILCATMEATDSLVGAMRRALGRDGVKKEESKWSEDDMDEVRDYLSPKSFCTTGGLGLTAEFPLKDGAVSAVMGDSQTAL